MKARQRVPAPQSGEPRRGCQRGSRDHFFLLRRLAETEDRSQQTGNPGNVRLGLYAPGPNIAREGDIFHREGSMTRLVTTAGVVLASIMVAAPVNAQNTVSPERAFYLSTQANLRKDYGESLRWLQIAEPASVNWEPFHRSAVRLRFGVYYENGLGGLPQNYNLAMSWYLRAAADATVCPSDYGNQAPSESLANAGLVAEYNIGRLYTDGKGVPRDLDKARMWITKTACALQDAQSWLREHPTQEAIEQHRKADRQAVEAPRNERVSPTVHPSARQAPPPPGSNSNEDNCTLADHTLAPKVMGPIAGGWYLGGGCN
jgi:hypothetical protein